MIYLACSLFFIAAGCYGVMSRISHGNFRFAKDEYGFWGNRSGRRKYKFPYQPPLGNLYYKLNKLDYREKYPLSATLLVAFTDGFHLMQLFFKIFMIATLLLYPTVDLNWKTILLPLVVWGVGFTIAYIGTKK